MEIKNKKIDELIPYINNARTHSEEHILQVAASIKEFGFLNPILIDDKNILIAGHGRLLAAKKIGMKEVPTIELRGLSLSQKKAYIIADNKIALNSGWDENLLRLEISDISNDINIDLLGFSTEEMSKLFDETGGIEIGEELENIEECCFVVKCDKSDIDDAINSVSDAVKKIKSVTLWVNDEQV